MKKQIFNEEQELQYDENGSFRIIKDETEVPAEMKKMETQMSEQKAV